MHKISGLTAQYCITNLGTLPSGRLFLPPTLISFFFFNIFRNTYTRTHREAIILMKMETMHLGETEGC